MFMKHRIRRPDVCLTDHGWTLFRRACLQYHPTEMVSPETSFERPSHYSACLLKQTNDAKSRNDASTCSIRGPAPTSPWRPFGNRIFRDLLAADLVSGIGAFTQSVGAAWLMTSLTNNLHRIDSDCIRAAVFLVGGLYRRYLRPAQADTLTEIWMFGIAAVLAVTIAGAITPCLLLLLTLALSLGDAVESPAWGAIFPELVNNDDLPAALALNGIEFNLARAVEPGLAGMIIAVIGAAAAFIVNARHFLG